MKKIFKLQLLLVVVLIMLPVMRIAEMIGMNPKNSPKFNAFVISIGHKVGYAMGEVEKL